MTFGGRLQDWALLLLCNLIWGSQFVVYKIVQSQVGPLFASLFPIIVATLLMAPLVFSSSRKKPVPQSRRVFRHDILQFIAIGVFGQVVAQAGMALGVRMAPASDAALISLMLPVITALMAYLFLGEKMTAVRWISFALAIAGIIECSGVQWGHLNPSSSTALLGNLILVCAISGSAFYNAYSKKLLTHYSPLTVLFYSYCVVIILMLPITLLWEPQSFRNLPHFTLPVWIGFLVLAFFQYFLAMVIFLSVLTRIEATQAALSNYLIPFFGVLIAAIVLHERLTTYMMFGGMLVLTATALVTFHEVQRR